MITVQVTINQEEGGLKFDVGIYKTGKNTLDERLAAAWMEKIVLDHLEAYGKVETQEVNNDTSKIQG